MRNSQRFISLFKKLEMLAAKESNSSRETAFSKMLATLTKKNNIFSFYKEELQQYAKLRNAIVHESVSDDQAIAEPHDEVVRKFEEIVSKIENPPKVIPIFQVKIETVTLNEPIYNALDRMYKGNYSQLPVLNNGKFFDLLTTDCIARWVAAIQDKEKLIIEDTKKSTVTAILEHKEFEINYRFISRNTTIVKAIQIFQEVETKQNFIDALLITQDGKKEQKLIGIITHYDLPAMMQTL